VENNNELFEQNSVDLTFDDGFDLEKPKSAWRTLKRLWKTSKEQHGRLFLVLISVVFYTGLTIAAPWYSAGIVNLLWENIKEAGALGVAFRVTWQQGGTQIFILFLLYLGSWIFYTLQSYVMLSFAERLSLRFRIELSKKLNRLPLSYYDRHKTGATLSHFTNDLDKMSEALQNGLLKLFTSVGLIIGSVIMMMRYHVWLTLIFIGFTLLSVLVTKLFSNATMKRASRRQQTMSNVTGLVEEYYSGRVIIKSFNQEKKSAEKMHAANEEMAQATEKADFVMNAINPAIRLVNRLGQVCIAVFAGKLLIDGALSVGVFQAFFQYVNQAAEPLTEASYVANSMQSALASAERVYSLLDELEMTAEPEELRKAFHAAGQVEFQNVRFGYAPDKELMKNISFKAKPGQKIAIVGTTGAGKTTLINLLMRFYEVNGGKILLDGVDTATMTRKELRSNFGMVLQDTWLFGGTIAENIAYGKPEATIEEIIAAAKAARVDFFVRTMPKGYQTILGNDSENISVGQRQLLTIARVVLCNPAVLILDEATSSVDTRTEIEINKAMKSLMNGRTSFVIAHRLSTIVDADLILVMENGNIIEQGNHAELLQAGGAYAELYNSQFAAS
jgi:ATP-binding cassette subfamily B multidrug efflux pump